MNRLEELYALLADVEAQLADPTLPHSDQQILDQAWEAYTNEIDAIESGQPYVAEEVEWQDAAEYLEEEDDEAPENDGLLMPSEEEMLALANAMVDDRGCETCAGCAYCEEASPYDGTDEV